MKTSDFKAKSDGTLLIEHSKNVSDVALKIAKLSKVKKEYEEPIRLSGLRRSHRQAIGRTSQM